MMGSASASSLVCGLSAPWKSLTRASCHVDSVLPQILKTLDGTAQKEAEKTKFEIEEAKQAGTLRVYDPPLCPATPTVQELDPYGYVRNADGSVESL